MIIVRVFDKGKGVLGLDSKQDCFSKGFREDRVLAFCETRDESIVIPFR